MYCDLDRTRSIIAFAHLHTKLKKYERIYNGIRKDKEAQQNKK